MMAVSPRMRNALTLFSSVDDVLCHRVRLVLAAKGVTYDFIPVDVQNPPEDLIDLNRKVSGDEQQNPADAAKQWLKDNGYDKAS